MLVLAFISTGLNLSSGILGIYFSIEGNLEMALRLLIIGAYFDVLDGRFARRAPTKSELGVYADSFADLFTFALLPAYMVLEANVFLGDITILTGITVAFVLAVFYSFAGWFRLVRFSAKPTGVMYRGLPSSAAAMFVGSLIVLYSQFTAIPLLDVLVTLAILFSATMMVSKIDYPSPKRMYKTDNYLFASASIMGLFYIFVPNIISLIIVIAIFLLYIFLGPYYYIKSEKNISGTY
jgi:phosphatidylserine synthase